MRKVVPAPANWRKLILKVSDAHYDEFLDGRRREYALGLFWKDGKLEGDWMLRTGRRVHLYPRGREAKPWKGMLVAVEKHFFTLLPEELQAIVLEPQQGFWLQPTFGAAFYALPEAEVEIWNRKGGWSWGGGKYGARE